MVPGSAVAGNRSPVLYVGGLSGLCGGALLSHIARQPTYCTFTRRGADPCIIGLVDLEPEFKSKEPKWPTNKRRIHVL
jgi:hypothetical protein